MKQCHGILPCILNRLPKPINFTLAGLMQGTLHTQDTHTFPMYRLGQTSSTGVSSRELESKMSSSSLMSTRSCRWLLPDILPRHRAAPPADPNTAAAAAAAAAVCVHCLFTATVCSSSVRDTSRWPLECRLPPKLAPCVR